MLFYSRRVVVIQINDVMLSVAEFDGTNSDIKLTSANSLRLPADTVFHGAIVDEKHFADILAEALRTATPRAIKTKEAIVVIPESQAYFTLLHFDEMKSQTEILSEISKEALTAIPLDPREMYSDFFTVSQQAGEKKHEVVYAACDKKVADLYFKILSTMNLSPVFYAVEPDMLINSTKASLSNTPVAFLSLGEAHSYWVLAEQGIAKKVARSTVKITNDALPENTAERLNSELSELLTSYLSVEEKVVTPSQLIVHIDSSSIIGEQFVDKLKNAIKMPIELLSPIYSDTHAFVQMAFGAAKMYFGRTNEKRTVDLLPAEYRKKAESLFIDSFVTLISVMLIIGASAFISVFSYAWSELHFESIRAQKENAIPIAQATRFQEIQKQTRRFNDEVNILTQIQAKLYPMYSVWDTFQNVIFHSAVTPDSVQFTRKDMSFAVTGVAATRDDLAAFRKKLEALPFVLEVISPLSNLDKTTNISFLLNIKLNPKTISYFGS